ncbi:MAG: nucleotidyltransferase family protein [Candidatus Competibacteraceae bacterium]
MPHRPDTLTPEMRLLLLCAHKTLPPFSYDRVGALLRQPLDWQRFLQLADRHQVAPLVWHSLQSAPNLTLPTEVESALRQRAEANTWAMLARTAELARLVQLLEQADIRAMPLKGPVLALMAYGNLALRQGGDLDLLVDPARFWEAERILLNAGYTRQHPHFELSPLQAAANFKIDHHSIYRHDARGFEVELHWQWTQNAFLFPLSFEEAWQQRIPLLIGGVTMATLPGEDLLLYLCVHGAASEWCRLKWLCDIPELLALVQRTGLEHVIARAKQLGVSRLLAQGLLLAHELLDTPLPSVITALAQQERIVSTLIERPHRALFRDRSLWDDSVGRRLAHLFYSLNFRPEFAYKWRSLYCFCLRTEDYAVIRLPDRLFPLYFLLRPFIWLFRQRQKHRQ